MVAFAIPTVGSPLTLATLGYTIVIALSKRAAPLGWTVYFRILYYLLMGFFSIKTYFVSSHYGFLSSHINFILFYFISRHDFIVSSIFYLFGYSVLSRSGYIFLLLLICGDVESNPGPQHNARKCRILSSNIRGLYSNLNDLNVVSPNYDIILCSEKLVSDRRNINELLIPGFNKPKLLIRDSRPRVRGLATYIRSGFPASIMSDNVCQCHEVQLVRVCSRINNFYIFNVYRNPDLDSSIFDCLLESMHSIQRSDRKSCFIFVGDLNVHHRDWLVSVSGTDSAGEAAYNFSNLSGCDQLIDVATHVGGNCLDLLLTDVPGVVDHFVKPPLGTSDHCAISFKIKLSFSVPDVRFTRRVYLKDRANWNAITEDVASINWRNIFQSTNPVGSLNIKLTEIIDRRVPQRVIQTRARDKAWFNEDCRRAHDDKQHAFRRWSRDKCRDLWDTYTRLRSHAARVYASAQEEHFGNLRASIGNARQPHEWWSTLKRSLFGIDSALPPLRNGDGGLAFDPKQKAEILSSSFISKQSAWSPELPATCHPMPCVTNVAFRSANVCKLLADLDSGGGVDPNGIFPLFLKRIRKTLAPKLAILFRILLSSGSFPTDWRSANITPIPKGSSCSQYPSEYRPISITPVLSKVYEKLLYKKLYNYAERNNLFPETQFGFRKGLGTTDALLTLIHDLQSGLDSRSEARVVSLDFSSAFDLVNHRALVFKLQAMGVGGRVLNVIKEFLTDRLQCVSVDGQLSDHCRVISGVPQGSVLGPLLFILFTSDMWSGLENKLISYADDTTLYAGIDSPMDRNVVADSLNRDLLRIHAWCQQWGMKLNPMKTQSIIVGRSKTVNPGHPPLTVCGQDLPLASYIKLLGVTIDDKLTFEMHIRALSSSLARKGGVLRKCFKIFRDEDIARKTFYSFILPCFEYCSPVWMSAAPSHLRLLERSLNCMRFIVPDLSLDLETRRVLSGLSSLYKIFKCPKHPMHLKLPAPFVHRRLTRFSQSLNSYAFQYVRHNTNQYSRCFIPLFCGLWNNLPSSIIEAGSMTEFKAAIKQLR